jgi:hypothetical protein
MRGEGEHLRVADAPRLASLFAVATAMRASAAPPSAVIRHVYVNDNNTSGVNTIGAFDRHTVGTLTPMPGSPFVRAVSAARRRRCHEARCN